MGKKSVDETMREARELLDSLGPVTITPKDIEGFANRFERIVQSCRQLERDSAASPPHRVWSELEPYSARWSVLLNEWQNTIDAILEKCETSSDLAVANVHLLGEGTLLDKAAAALLEFFDLPCALKSTRVLPDKGAEKHSELAPTIRRLLADAAKRPDPKPEEAGIP